MSINAFNNEKYLEIQKKEILKRIQNLGGKLYLECGGKLFDDYHASRVLPGFLPDSKLQLLKSFKNECEIIIVVNSNDIKNRKIRGDIGITYDIEVERLIMAYKKEGFIVNSIVFSFYEPNETVDFFIRKLRHLKIKTYKHYKIAGYPSNIPLIVSKDGLGKNEYILTDKPLVVVTAPGPGSGKMATCLSQLYHDNQHGISSGYAKLETFPVWNLSLTDPLNVAYEAATLDLNDVNMIDPYHMEKYGLIAVNYNRDIEIFPLLKNILISISGQCPYNSPTDMGVNMVGFAIEDKEAVNKAAKEEIIRRYYAAQKDFLVGKIDDAVLNKSEYLLKSLDITPKDRECVEPAIKKAEKTGSPSICIQMHDGTLITGKRSNLLTSSAAVLLNALKYLAKINDDIPLLSPEVIEPIQTLKLGPLQNANPKIHAEEILIALAIQAYTNPLAKYAISYLDELKNCEAHSSCLLAQVDLKTFNKLGIHMTEEPQGYFYKNN